MAIPLTQIKGIEFNVKRNLFLGVDAMLVLLKEKGTDVPFEVVRTVTVDWNVEFPEHFNNAQCLVAEATASFASDVRKSTHLMMTDTVNTELNNVLYEIQDDSQPPLGDKPFWRIYAKSQRRTYVAPEEI